MRATDCRVVNGRILPPDGGPPDRLAGVAPDPAATRKKGPDVPRDMTMGEALRLEFTEPLRARIAALEAERDAARAELDRTADDVLAVVENREPEAWAWPLHALRDALVAARGERDAYREVAETMHMRYVGKGRNAAICYVSDLLPRAKRFLAKGGAE